MKKIIFITGTGRNGSTLLDMALNAHSRIFSLGEISSFSRDLVTKKSLCGCYKTFEKCLFWNEIIDSIENDNNICIRENPDLFDTVVPTSYSGFIKNFLFRIKFGLALFKIKKFSFFYSNNIVKNIDQLYENVFKKKSVNIITDSYKNVRRAIILSSQLKNKYKFKFIHIVRDGRGVLNSYMKNYYKVLIPNEESGKLEKKKITLNSQEPGEIMRQWRKVNLENLIFLGFFRRSAYMQIRYEDLCVEPEKTLKRIVAFIGVDFEPEMLKINRFENHIIRGNPIAKFYAKEIKKPNMSFIADLSPEMKNLFRKKASWLNKQFGYK